MKLSIVTSLYQSSSYIYEFYKRISKVAQHLVGDSYEVIFVNDGSPDDSLGKAIGLSDLDSNVIVVDLSRNFGHHKAIMTGIEIAKGDYVFAIDIDLEEKPELLVDFWDEINCKKADVVVGVQKSRKGGFVERVTGAFFYWLLNWLSNIDITPNALMAKIMTKQFAKALVSHRESNIFLGGLVDITGFSKSVISCDKGHKGTTVYTFRKKLMQAANSIFSFSEKPVYMLFFSGAFVFFGSVIASFLLLVDKLFFTSYLPGWVSLVVIMLLLFGLVLISIGIVGVYISMIFQEVKARPYVIIKNIHGGDQ